MYIFLCTRKSRILRVIQFSAFVSMKFPAFYANACNDIASANFINNRTLSLLSTDPFSGTFIRITSYNISLKNTLIVSYRIVTTVPVIDIICKIQAASLHSSRTEADNLFIATGSRTWYDEFVARMFSKLKRTESFSTQHRARFLNWFLQHIMRIRIAPSVAEFVIISFALRHFRLLRTLMPQWNFINRAARLLGIA